ncbi:hypothetical protein V466_29870 [Pseudomonas mandelii PD30]|uniref:Uncharacterized protein n=1 Tax=Pseudomonas mandelii PD30 TaxID=1419583 RepID=A0A059KUI8_9PSED|nr:hypothetical protein V466_29870 [Pseudomonas mandelii PD30]
MVAFCALAAFVKKIGFWLIAIIIAGRAQVIGEGVFMTWDPSASRRLF